MRARSPSRRAGAAGVAIACAAAAAGLLAGCRGDVSENRPRQFFPDMDDQPKLKPQSESAFFAEYVAEDGTRYGRGMREPVYGTVAFGAQPFTQEFEGRDFSMRDEYLRPDAEVATGKRLLTDASGSVRLDESGAPAFEYLELIPIPVTMELVELGRKKFNILCMPCHGGTGMGDGLVGRRWQYALPSFMDARFQRGGETGQDGYIFHTIRNGLPNPGGAWELKMPSYGRKLTIEETWAVVSYFRALQTHRGGTAEMLPGPLRLELERRRAQGAGSASPGSGALASGKEGSP